MHLIAQIILVFHVYSSIFQNVNCQPLVHQGIWFPQNYGRSAKRTEVIWMIPSWKCTGNHSIEVEKYGVLQNEDQKFVNGSKFAIFYEHTFGKVPYFENQELEKIKNGGLPQLADLAEHLRIAEENITTTIPDPNFDGIAVIDIEEFRPTWSLSWGSFEVYKRESIALVRNRHPYWPVRLIEKQAEQDYNYAAKTFFLETLRLGKKLRPKAKWGYYLFPKCNAVRKTNVNDCSKDFQKYNEEMSWLWVESTALFPSMYLYPRNKDIPEENFVEVSALIVETRRIQMNYCPRCEIHVFTTIEYDAYHSPDEFYSKQNLASTFENTMNSNVQSVVIWGTSTKISKRCDLISDYVESTLGPYLQLIDRKLDKCREKRCSSHGECYLRRAMKNPNLFNYRCRCDFPYSGRSCEYENLTAKALAIKQRPRTTPKFLSISRRKYNSANQLYYLANRRRNSSSTSSSNISNINSNNTIDNKIFENNLLNRVQ